MRHVDQAADRAQRYLAVHSAQRVKHMLHFARLPTLAALVLIAPGVVRADGSLYSARFLDTP